MDISPYSKKFKLKTKFFLNLFKSIQNKNSFFHPRIDEAYNYTIFIELWYTYNFELIFFQTREVFCYFL
jgi:hypothetical protein